MAELDDRTAVRLTTGSVVPRPIGWIGTRSRGGINNLAPFSFFNAVSTCPPQVAVSTSVRAGHRKDTLVNLEETAVFSVNLVTWDLRHEMNASSAAVPSETDEFDLAGFEPADCREIDAPLVERAPISMECRVEFARPLGSGAEYYVLTVGRIVRFHVAPNIVDASGRIDQRSLGVIARMGGPTYTVVSDLFDMERP